MGIRYSPILCKNGSTQQNWWTTRVEPSSSKTKQDFNLIKEEKDLKETPFYVHLDYTTPGTIDLLSIGASEVAKQKKYET